MKECEHNGESMSGGNKVSEDSFAFVILGLARENPETHGFAFRQHGCNKASSIKQANRDKDVLL